MNKGDILEVLIEDMDKDGKGIAYYNKKIIFIPYAIIGETCKIEITKVLSKLYEANLLEVLNESPYRKQPDCNLYPLCGGCQMRHMSYELEKKVKFNKVKNTITHSAKISDFKMNELISNDIINNYRNKAIIPFAKVNNEIICGMYKGRSHEIISNLNCQIEPRLLEKILIKVKKYLIENNVSIYDETTKNGLFRALMCRKTKDDKYMIVLITTKKYDFSALVNELIKIENIVSIYLNINDLNNNVLLTDNNILLYGKANLKEDILGHKFNVAPNTFLQVNNNMCELLYKEAITLLNPKKDETIIDAYCGMGSITLNVAPYVKQIIGIEVVKSAIDNAIINAKMNGINNAKFILGKCEDKILEIIRSTKVNSIIFDPPRKGCDVSFLNVIKEAKINKIVYISCNVATLARDLNYLKDTYKIVEVTPFDLFPRTSHVESICTLSRKD